MKFLSRQFVLFVCLFVVFLTINFYQKIGYIALYENLKKHRRSLQYANDSSVKQSSFEQFLYTNESELFANPKEVWISEALRKKTKLILVWNSFFGTYFTNQNLGGCPEYNCEISSDRNDFKRAEAVIFHMYGVGGLTDAIEAKNQRHRYVWFGLESPIHITTQDHPNVFEYSMTARRDSDIPCPYGYTLRRNESLQKIDYQSILSNKTRIVAWFVSNCQSERLRYVQELAKHIDVDIYGGCGANKQCPDGMDRRQCDLWVHKNYYFYLGLENNVCKDQVTEKFWMRANEGNLIPIVFKRSLLGRIAPSTSFIAADDFKTVKDLAVFLQNLVKQPEEYIRLLRYQEQYKIVFLDGSNHDRYERPFGFCLLCKKLWTEPKPKPHANIQDWWYTQAKCDNDLVAKLTDTTPPPVLLFKTDNVTALDGASVQ